ncbi:MAG: M23 family metallopeptidase [Leptospirales bacterium]|jgi:murein DD-endopeptidase
MRTAFRNLFARSGFRCSPGRAASKKLVVRLAPGALLLAAIAGASLTDPGTRVAAETHTSGQQADSKPAPEPTIESGIRRWHARGASRIALPDGYSPPRPQRKLFQTAAYQLRLYAHEFAQGRAVYVEILPPDGASAAPENFQAALIHNQKSVPLSRHPFGYRGFIGIAPYAAVGKTVLSVTAGNAPGGLKTGRHKLQIAKTKFPVYRSAMNLGEFSDTSKALTAAQLAQITAGRAKKNRAFNLRTENQIDDRLSHPRDLHKITSPFWAKRVVSRFKIVNGKRVDLKPKTSTHGGLDLRAVTGAPIHALATGTVAVAEAMYYEGQFTMLDHGQGVMSIYMHQSALNVQPGQTVQAGDEIGKAGATGAVTGAHLHIAVYIRRVPVEPLSFLALPVRN